MQQFNIRFVLFFVDPRQSDEICMALDAAFGGRFEQDMEHKAKGSMRLTSRVLGIHISCLQETFWTEGIVYRLTGGNDSQYRFIGAEEIDVDFHVSLLLADMEPVKIMTLKEYQEESKRRR